MEGGEAASAACATGMAATAPGTAADETGTAGPGGDVVGSASARRPASAAVHAAADQERGEITTHARPTALIQVASAVEAAVTVNNSETRSGGI